MVNLDNEELLNIVGGSSAWFSATFLNAASRAVSTLLDLGRSFGTAIRRAFSGAFCAL